MSIEKRIHNLANATFKLKNNPEMDEIKNSLEQRNPWFIKEFVDFSINGISQQMLNVEKLTEFVNFYHLKDQFSISKCIAIIMAGNIPLVGLHDFVCCYLTGCKIQIKLSSKEDFLFRTFLKYLKEEDSRVENDVRIVEKVKDFDAIIATGSDTTFPYFQHYFSKYPNILRKNRNSIAILNGEESATDLDLLADDIFLYFGLGCRNVSKLYVPKNYDFNKLFPHFEKYAWFHHHSKYMNNYDYNRTLLLMNKTPHLSDDKINLLESKSFNSPISILHYEYYSKIDEVINELNEYKLLIQCIVSNYKIKNKLPILNFGESQKPGLFDYADGIDIMQFLMVLE